MSEVPMISPLRVSLNIVTVHAEYDRDITTLNRGCGLVMSYLVTELYLS